MEINFSNKCRVCLGDEKEMHYIFDEFDQGITLQDIIINTTNFQVEKDDGFSPFICQGCTTVIVDFYNLKAIYIENENQIKAYLANTELNSEENEPLEKVCEEENREGEGESRSDTEDMDYITIKVESYSSDNESSAGGLKSTEHNAENELQLDKTHIRNTDQSRDEHESEAGDNNLVKYEYQEINTFLCPECGDCFLYKDDIQAHLVSKHDIRKVDFDEISEVSLLKVKVNDQLPFENNCKICNRHFENDKDYKKHLYTHKKNVCDICGIGFVKKSYLKDHLEIHCNEKKHKCNYCNKAFKRRTVLVKHKRIHTHPRQCICEMCGKAFNDKGTLKTHIMLLHVRERNYMCLICGVKFPLKATLEKHIRRHQNKEKEFFCTQCPLGYRDKSSLDRHIFVKHSGQNIKPTCKHCGKHYTTMGNLFKHQRICHNEAVHITDTRENQ